MTSDTPESGERLTRSALIEEFRTARQRRQSARHVGAARAQAMGKTLPLGGDPPQAPEHSGDVLDLIRWGSDKG
jgi:hypothetical protein